MMNFVDKIVVKFEREKSKKEERNKKRPPKTTRKQFTNGNKYIPTNNYIKYNNSRGFKHPTHINGQIIHLEYQ